MDENGHLQWIFPLNMVIFNSYDKLPESTSQLLDEALTQSATVLEGSAHQPAVNLRHSVHAGALNVAHQ